MRDRWAGAFPIGVLSSMVLALGLWNAHHYPPGNGYDAAGHIAYADGLVPGLDLPAGTGEFHNPPLFYLVAGSVDWVAAKAGLGEPRDATQLLNVFFFLIAVFTVWRTALLLWPGRERLALAAATFTALLPVAVRASVMFHPEALDMLLAAVAVYLCVLLCRSRHSTRVALTLGVTLGAAQLARTFAVWVVAAVLVALFAAGERRAFAVVAAVAVLIPAPWYARQWAVYGTPIPFNRPAPSAPLYARRPASFYFDPGLPDVFTHPYRPHFANLAIPTTYAELWGDYYGIWNWQAKRGSPGPRARWWLRLQALVGVIPTILAFAGCAILFLASRRDRALAVVGWLAAFGLVGYLAFTVAYPSKDGDVLKATYLLSTTIAWALGFAYGLARLPQGVRRVVGAALIAGALAELPYLIYG